MSTETSQAQAANETSIPAPDDLVATTLAMLGGAPQAEITRLKGEEKAAVERMTATPQVEAPVATPEAAAEPAEVAEPATEVVEEAPPAEEASTLTATAEAARLEKIATEEAQERFRFNRDEDRAIAQLAKAQNISITEAVKRYSLTKPAEPEPVEAQASPEVQTLEARIAEIDAQIETETGGAAVLSTVSLRKLERERGETIADLKVAKLQEAQAVALRQQMSQQWRSVEKQVEAAYPEMVDHDSAQYLLASKLAEKAGADPNHPDYSATFDASAPRYFADKAAAKLKIPAAKAPVKVAEVPKLPATKLPTPAAGSRSTSPPPAAKTATTQAQEAMDKTLGMLGGNRQNSRAVGTMVIL